MTFIELDSAETFDLALELYFAGDAPDLDSAAQLAADLNTPLFDFAQEWDLDSHEWELALAFAQTA